MAQKLYEESNIQAIADAIRQKNGTTTKYKTSEMASAIAAIQSGGGGETATKFTNVLELSDTVVKDGYRWSGSGGGYSAHANTLSIAFKVPSNAQLKIRWRGALSCPSVNYKTVYAIENPNATPNHATICSDLLASWSIDEHGDNCVSINNNTSYQYIVLMFQSNNIAGAKYPNGSTVVDASNFIITVNKPIGNGGHIG